MMPSASDEFASQVVCRLRRGGSAACIAVSLCMCGPALYSAAPRRTLKLFTSEGDTIGLGVTAYHAGVARDWTLKAENNDFRHHFANIDFWRTLVLALFELYGGGDGIFEVGAPFAVENFRGVAGDVGVAQQQMRELILARFNGAEMILANDGRAANLRAIGADEGGRSVYISSRFGIFRLFCEDGQNCIIGWGFDAVPPPAVDAGPPPARVRLPMTIAPPRRNGAPIRRAPFWVGHLCHLGWPPR